MEWKRLSVDQVDHTRVVTEMKYVISWGFPCYIVQVRQMRATMAFGNPTIHKASGGYDSNYREILQDVFQA
jgi:hypothetical protein